MDQEKYNLMNFWQLCLGLKVANRKAANEIQLFLIFFKVIDFINFKELSKGNLGEEYDKNMSFNLNVSQFRRRKIL
jgi:hypothetical protein